MKTLKSRRGITLSYTQDGDGPPLVLVHGGFSDQRTNWEFVLPKLAEQFTVYAIARRGRGLTEETQGHSLEDEAQDAIELIESINEPVYLLGHSYGAHVSLRAARDVVERVRKLIAYEPPVLSLMRGSLEEVELRARVGDWDGLATYFFGEVLKVPVHELEALRHSEFWAPILMDARATLGDLRALARYEFDLEACRQLTMPVSLQTGTESPAELYLTQALHSVLPDSRIDALEGQAHEGMTTNPEQYVESVLQFLNEPARELIAQGKGAAD
jgi:pimeloyl-ACP methyl ester carboxylesterase